MAYILIVDDDADFSSAVATVLHNAGHQTAIEDRPDGADRQFEESTARRHCARCDVSGESYRRFRSGPHDPPCLQGVANPDADCHQISSSRSDLQQEYGSEIDPA